MSNYFNNINCHFKVYFIVKKNSHTLRVNLHFKAHVTYLIITLSVLYYLILHLVWHSFEEDHVNTRIHSFGNHSKPWYKLKSCGITNLLWGQNFGGEVFYFHRT